MTRGLSHGKGVSLPALITMLSEQPATCTCSWHIETSSEFVTDTETHRHEREFPRLVVAIDLPPRVVAIPLPKERR